MSLIHEYWLDDPTAPYATFLTLLNTYLDFEVYDENDLKERVTRRSSQPKMQQFKEEFREVIRDPSVLPKGALSTAAQYEDASDEAFLNRLWHELYGDEPV